MFVLAANHAEKCLVFDVVGGKKWSLTEFIHKSKVVNIVTYRSFEFLLQLYSCKQNMVYAIMKVVHVRITVT